MKRDPICQMPVEEKNALTAECDGKVFYFCSSGCREKFLREKTCRLPQSFYDLVIVGGGPAGLTAAIYAATLKLNAFLIARDLGGQAIDSTKIENYMGFDLITGPELIKKFQDQLLHSHFVDHLLSEVVKIEAVSGGFKVLTSLNGNYWSRTLILATGMARRKLGVPGEERLQRRGVFYGSIPDLSFVQGVEVAVIGGGNSAVQMVENLQTVARQIHLVARSGLTADPAEVERLDQVSNLTRYEGYDTLEFTGENALTGIRIRRKGAEEILSVPVKGVFIAIGMKANSAPAVDLVTVNARGEIVVGPDCSTSSTGIFAAGDVTDVYGKRIIIAAGEGAKAAIAAREYLLSLEKSSDR
jgi:NADH-dependent peroxiredoxin subunit F